MAPNLREQILKCDDLKTEVLDIPEWGCEVMVKELTAKQRQQIFNASKGAVDTEKLTAMYLLNCICDPLNGERIFEDADRDAVLGKSSRVTERIITRVLVLSGISEEEENPKK